MNIQAIINATIVIDDMRIKIYALDEALRAHNSNYDVVDVLKSGVIFPKTLVMAVGPAKGLKQISKRYPCFLREGFAYVTTGTNVLYARSGSTKSELLIEHKTAIIYLAADGDWISVADGESSFSLYHEKCFEFGIPIFTSSVRSCAVSSNFQLVVCGTRDGSLLFCSLNLQIVVKIVDLHRRPIKICITPSWGFVCVYLREVTEGVLKHMLALYTVNGEHIREIEIPGRLVAWNVWVDSEGFDHIAMGLEDGRCYFFEAFWLEIGQPWFEVPGCIAGIAFAQGADAAVIVSTNGQVIVVPRGEHFIE
jgi:hypothetical protein